MGKCSTTLDEVVLVKSGAEAALQMPVARRELRSLVCLVVRAAAEILRYAQDDNVNLLGCWRCDVRKQCGESLTLRESFWEAGTRR